ncbi:MAG: hypothetical protein PHY72_00085 [Candidatus Pacebacteria bacterium]|nr:hypothetical protein [Candidatus Paceibacterota bacterium]
MLEKEQLEKLYKTGISMKEVAIRLGCSEDKVDYWIEKHSIQKRSRSEASYYGYWRLRNSGKIIPPFLNGKSFELKQVRDLYLEKGFSAQEVGQFFGRSVSSVYDFMRKYGIERRPIAQTNNFIFERKQLSFNIKKNLSKKEEKLKVAGIMLYWAEGGKEVYRDGQRRATSVNFANSDPEMVKIFLRFLREICGISEQRLRVHLYCYTNQDIDYLKKYWQETTNIPLTQFIKPYVRENFSENKKHKMEHGLVHIVYSDKKLFLKIMDWINEYINEQ